MFHFLAISYFLQYAVACSNYLVTRGASDNNSTMISYNADSEALYGCIYHTSAGTHAPGEMIKIYDWDSTEFLGEIPQAPVTYNVFGNTNELQVAITETTFGGVPQLQQQSKAIIDYGSLIYLALARSTSARDAIATMADLVQTYGYYSEGESFSIADEQEVWILEMIGKGEYELGAVWVAVRIPDGAVSGHANQARIRQFPLNDPENCLYAPDVVDFARKIGLYSGKDEDFSFSDTYNPVTFDGARFCEARVWSMINKVTDLGPQYLDYAQGYNLTNRMPLWVFPDHRISLEEIQGWMGDHYENTWLEFSSDVGAESSHTPYRWRPLTWSVNSQPGFTYLNERSAGTQQTGFTMVAQQRGYLPDGIGGLLWFAADEGATAVYAPFYSSGQEVPPQYQCYWSGSGPNGPLTSGFSTQTAFWIFNMVANFAYSRWDVIAPDLKSKQHSWATSFANTVSANDASALEMLANGASSADVLNFLTQANLQVADDLISDWNNYYATIFMKYKDGYIITPSTDGSYLPIIGNPGYSQDWLQRIVADAGSKYLIPPSAQFAIDGNGKRVLAAPLNEARKKSKSFL